MFVTTLFTNNINIHVPPDDCDYMGVNQLFVINLGDPKPCIDIPIISDDDIEVCESFNVTITTSDTNVWLTQSSAIVYINEGISIIAY